MQTKKTQQTTKPTPKWTRWIFTVHHWNPSKWISFRFFFAFAYFSLDNLRPKNEEMWWLYQHRVHYNLGCCLPNTHFKLWTKVTVSSADSCTVSIFVVFSRFTVVKMPISNIQWTFFAWLFFSFSLFFSQLNADSKSSQYWFFLFLTVNAISTPYSASVYIRRNQLVSIRRQFA